MKKLDLLYLGAGVLAVSAGAQMISDHIDKTENDKAMRIFKKVGVGCGCFALGGFMTDILTSGNMARAYYGGTMRVKLNS